MFLMFNVNHIMDINSLVREFLAVCLIFGGFLKNGDKTLLLTAILSGFLFVGTVKSSIRVESRWFAISFRTANQRLDDK